MKMAVEVGSIDKTKQKTFTHMNKAKKFSDTKLSILEIDKTYALSAVNSFLVDINLHEGNISLSYLTFDSIIDFELLDNSYTFPFLYHVGAIENCMLVGISNSGLENIEQSSKDLIYV